MTVKTKKIADAKPKTPVTSKAAGPAARTAKPGTPKTAPVKANAPKAASAKPAKAAKPSAKPVEAAKKPASPAPAPKAKSPARSVAVPVPPAPARSEPPAPTTAAAKPTAGRAPTRPNAPPPAAQRPAHVAPKAGPKPMTPQDVAARFAQQRQAQATAAAATAQAPAQPGEAKKPISQRHGFKINEHIVYPAHGVGRIVGIEEQEIAGMSLELFVITFDKDKMTLRVPTAKLQAGGMRKLSDEAIVKRAMETLKGRARIKRTMWSRRAQEYEAKINSGDLIAVAEVVRDLYRSEAQPEQSYSERQLYELALDRMAREIGAVEKLDDRGAVQRITDELARSARGRRLAAEEAAAAEAGDDGDGDEEADGDVQAA